MLNVGDTVRVSRPINFGGGRSPWVGRTGIVRGHLRTARAVLVKLDGDSGEPFLFFLRELSKIPDVDN